MGGVLRDIQRGVKDCQVSDPMMGLGRWGVGHDTEGMTLSVMTLRRNSAGVGRMNSVGDTLYLECLRHIRRIQC